MTHQSLMTTKVITFCSTEYVTLATRWSERVRELGIHDYLVIASDKTAHSRLLKRNISTRFISSAGYPGVNGQYRMHIVYQYLASGFDVLLTDLDTRWRKNILPEYADDQRGIDIYASQGTTNPVTVLRKLGFVMCCGFLYLRSNENVLNFFEIYTRQLVGLDRDQEKFNTLLKNTQWDTAAVARRLFWTNRKGYTWRYFDSDVMGYNRYFNLKMCLISMFKVQRGYIDGTGYIYHFPKAEKFRQLDRRPFSGLFPFLVSGLQTIRRGLRRES